MKNQTNSNMETTTEKGKFMRDVDFATAMLIKDFKQKITDVKCILPSGHSGTKKLDKAVKLDMLAATFYRKGAEVFINADGGLAWTFNGSTFIPVQ